MKSLIIFSISLVVGFLLVTGYAYWNHQRTFALVPTPVITTKFSLANAPQDSLKGEIASVSGSVNWLSRVAKKPVLLTSKHSIQQGEELGTGKNGNAIVTIQHTTAVLLSANSHINFIQILPINMVIAQDKGSVIYENVGSNALTVNTLDLITAINRSWVQISVDPVAKSVTVTVQKGSITVGYEDLQNTSNVVTVDAGKEFVFDDTSRIGTVF
jgi:hypothetical protein